MSDIREQGTSTGNETGSLLFEGITVDEDPSKWLQSIRDRLYSMFCSPMKEDYTHEAFKWVSHLCMSIGDFSWISTKGNWTAQEVKIFSCIVRLSMSEIQILLPIIQRTLTCGENPEFEDGKVLARSANSSDYDKFGDHLVILESAIKTLVKDQTEDEINELAGAIKGPELKSLLEQLKETLTLIIEYLELVHQHWDELSKHRASEKLSSAEAGLRITCVWLSEDPCGFENQCTKFLIDIIIKNLLMGGPSKHDLLILALHAICTGSKEMMMTLRGCTDYRKALEVYLGYVQREQKRSASDRRAQKVFKLRCGLVKDLMSD